MTFADGWTCRACWKSNRQQDPVCYRCKTPRDADEAQIEERKAAAEAAAATPEKVPDLLVALPVVIFRSYSRVWVRGGLGVLGILAFLVFGGVTDIGYLALTGGMGAGLIVIGFLSGEVSDAMRNREAWAFVVGAGLSVVAVIGSVMAFEILAPGLANPTAIRWGSVIVFGGAGVAAVAGLVLLFTRRDAEA
ncbi:MAG TPA: Ran-binding zinc finger domain-containing protein [Candidatus Limnocylindria bacterium]|jgi:cell shape-determining protein MreD